ncbi:MAG: tetratricopeptide repeat protein [Pirellulaceae bacterium]|nr:tetratricopeptide repeat protein [Pirellulaceae bacterium]
MMPGLNSEVSEIVLSNASFGPQEISKLASAISEDYTRYSLFRDAVSELETDEKPTPATAVRLGVCYYLLGNYKTARETLENADGGALAQFYLGKISFSRGEYEEAIQCYQAAQTAGYSADEITLATAEAKRYLGEPEESLRLLDQLFGPIEQTSEYLYQRGATVSALGGNLSEVVALYERAIESNGSHAGALFGLALENDRRGNDVKALELYERATSIFPTHVGSLLNLGLLYEDKDDYHKAQRCYERILDIFPTHSRALLYMKDTVASKDMFYDEEAQKQRDRLAQVLSIPVSDFELSVRSRNCLVKMGIITLGDLTRTTEMELLASKNFGETSLIEIRDILSSKNLTLGQFVHEKHAEDSGAEMEEMSPAERELLEQPIAELKLSVRARKCMARIGITTIGELTRRTGDDLLECKNFGVTSLVEVREKLTVLNLKLRND